MNWNSKTKTFTEVVKESTKMLKLKVITLSNKGYTIKKISDIIGRSEARVRELLK